MKQIWKYHLREEADILLQIPRGAKFLSVIPQRDLPVMYVLVDLDETKIEEWVITCVGTGVPIADKILRGVFLGTVATLDGALIWHCWRWQD